jgi:histidinol-phosphate aminotransferase
MSRFLSRHGAKLEPYVPGEQPSERKYIKLNTNECSYPPAPGIADLLAGQRVQEFSLYPDPEAKVLRRAIAHRYGLESDQVFVGNGSDEVLAFLCMAFFDTGDPIYFPDPSYGFYGVYAKLFGLNARLIPLAEDFTLTVEDYLGVDGHILIANPNAPTGLALPREEIQRIVQSNPNRLVVVDEAYVDFADDGVSSLPLLAHYDNLMVVGTFSKSRSLAGLRLGYAFSRREHIAALERIKYSFHPYNINRFTQQAATIAVQDEAYLRQVLKRIKATRDRSYSRLQELGCKVLPSSTNFLFVSHPTLKGKEFYKRLREKGILVRCFEHPRTLDFIRVSIGTEEEMNAFLHAVEETL